MNFKRWQELKQILTEDKDLSNIWTYYMDHFADHPKFINLGNRVQNEYIDAVVKKTCQQLFGQNVKITNSLLIHIPRHQFFHGPFQASGRIGGVIFFEDIKVGLMGISAQFPPTSEVQYSRFTEVMDLSPPTGHDLN
ncbi:hypothetical protein VB711_09870 [Cronbergia sp. UHCC 0137]|uniref:hypothetical protein n=1 Tax=Cronbergia sp. UHCC 0137 TaxID=3110239 RepID=UPI002B21DFCC|nr:hypothetical protein [Cronbergia sp. UHCC 0137]MEA5618139.1 hypothetical protein [Cronbergia sp. UHCC 0137]